uniref:Putative conserved secreted protein n=1 Tax=Culex tarsalis TaxID=7177 RepID=A0A1Q3FHT8_CULTA
MKLLLLLCLLSASAILGKPLEESEAQGSNDLIVQDAVEDVPAEESDATSEVEEAVDNPNPTVGDQVDSQEPSEEPEHEGSVEEEATEEPAEEQQTEDPEAIGDEAHQNSGEDHPEPPHPPKHPHHGHGKHHHPGHHGHGPRHGPPRAGPGHHHHPGGRRPFQEEGVY